MARSVTTRASLGAVLVSIAAVGIPRVAGVRVAIELRHVHAGVIQRDLRLLHFAVAFIEVAVPEVAHS